MLAKELRETNRFMEKSWCRLGPRAGVVALILLAACSSKENTVNIHNGTAGSAGAAAELPDCSDAGSASQTRGSPMAPVGNLAGQCFWMDVREASIEEYAAFVAGGHAETAPFCAWNTSYDPVCAEAGSGEAGAGDVTLPVTCADWCDAYSFCKWAGKSLCKGEYGNPADAARSDWYAVCSHGAVREYPYGEYTPDACNGMEKGVGAALAAGGQASCATPEGVLNLSGNVAEWVDECIDETGAGDKCNVRGGWFASDANALRCGEKRAITRDARFDWAGFRCCAYGPED
mgnify:CR=1 FL=1